MKSQQQKEQRKAREEEQHFASVSGARTPVVQNLLNSLLNFLLPQLPAATAGDDEARRRVIIGAAALLASPMMIYLSFVGFSLGLTIAGWLGLLTSCSIASVYFATRRGHGFWPARFGLIVTISLQLYVIVAAPDQFMLVWTMIIPLLTIFVFGRREGAVWSLVALLAYAFLLANPSWVGIDPSVDGWPLRGRLVDFIFPYLLALIMSLGYETLRQASQTRLQEVIAEQEESEARSRDFNRIGTDLLFELDRHFRIKDLSGSWQELTHFPISDVIGQNLFGDGSDIKISNWEQILKKLEKGEPIQDRVNLVVQDRNYIIEIRIAQTLNAKGRVIGYRGVGVDMTERVRTETALREKDRALQQSARMEAIGQLTAGVAHDFNNLLMVIIGNLELLEIKLEGKEQALEHVRKINTASMNAADLTGKLLAFSRRQSLQPEALHPNKIVEDVIGLLSRLMPENIRLNTQLDRKVPYCLADRSQLQSALLNLALNARDAMPNGGSLMLVVEGAEVKPREASGAEVKAGAYVSFKVIDNGHGIPEEMLSRIFEPFFTSKEVGRGTGLGLSMVYGFVRQSGGSIQVHSEVGKGTAVQFLIPQADSVLIEATEPPTANAFGRGEVILVVEDEVAVREVVVAMLKEIGFTTLSAANAEEGWREFQAGKPSAVISDVVLTGEKNGAELAHAIRKHESAVPIVLMSGYSESVFSSSDKLPGNISHLSKPFTKEELQACLKKLL